MGYKEKLDTHDWVLVGTRGIDMLTPSYPKYYKYISQFHCRNCICKAFSSHKDDNKGSRLDMPTKFDIFSKSPVWTCEEAQNNTIVQDIIE